MLPILGIVHILYVLVGRALSQPPKSSEQLAEF